MRAPVAAPSSQPLAAAPPQPVAAASEPVAAAAGVHLPSERWLLLPRSNHKNWEMRAPVAPPAGLAAALRLPVHQGQCVLPQPRDEERQVQPGQ